MPEIPRDSLPESTLALMRDPYRFISKRCERYRSDFFETTLMFERTLCMRGREAAALFYSPQRFARAGVAPMWLQKTLFGVGGVQGLDGAAHRHRKQMFMSLMTPERIERLAHITSEYWRVALGKWVRQKRVVLYPELREILTRAVCDWAGVPLAESEVKLRTYQLTAMFDQAAAIGLGHFLSRRARRQAEQWIADVIEAIRAGRYEPPEQSAAHVIAWHRDASGALLDRHTAAVELINVLRPTVAVSVYMTFVAVALHQYPTCRQRLRTGETEYAEAFVQEVRRFYPFFPLVMAQVRDDFAWKGYHFQKGTKVALDLYGTNHNARIWKEPEAFRPERFLGWDGDPYSLIPHGGGDHHRGHRCPGEWITIALMQATLRFLTTRIAYNVPAQDLTIDYRRLPALPRSRFILRNVSEMG